MLLWHELFKSRLAVLCYHAENVLFYSFFKKFFSISTAWWMLSSLSFTTVSFFLCSPPYRHHAHTFPSKVSLNVNWGGICIYACARCGPKMSLRKWFDSLDPKCTFMWWSTIQLCSDRKKTNLSARCVGGRRSDVYSDVYFHTFL